MKIFWLLYRNGKKELFFSLEGLKARMAKVQGVAEYKCDWIDEDKVPDFIAKFGASK